MRLGLPEVKIACIGIIFVGIITVSAGFWATMATPCIRVSIGGWKGIPIPDAMTKGPNWSLDNQYESDDSEDVSSILDYMGVPDPDLEGLADRVDLELALDGVDSREQAIIYLKFYSGLSQSAIAKRLGISQMHVSRLQRTALNKLKSSLIKQSSA